MICRVQTVHGRQAPVLAHQREAAADVAGDPLVGMRVRVVGMVRMVVMVVVVRRGKLVRDGRDGGQGLQGGEGGVSAARAHARGGFAHADGRVQVSRVAWVIVSAVQQGRHAHSAVAQTPRARTGMWTVATKQLPVSGH